MRQGVAATAVSDFAAQLVQDLRWTDDPGGDGDDGATEVDAWATIGAGELDATVGAGPLVRADWARAEEAALRHDIATLHLSAASAGSAKNDTDGEAGDGVIAHKPWPLVAPSKRPRCNSYEASRNMKYKNRASRILTPLGLQPWSMALDAKSQVSKEACRAQLRRFDRRQRIPFPVVVKPVAGMQGKGVVTGVKNIAGICNAVRDIIGKAGEAVQQFLDMAKRHKDPLLIIEEMVFGDNFRVFVVHGRVIDVIQREMAFVVGDGQKTLASLIRQRNARQRRAKLFPTIFVSWDMIRARYNLTKTDVVENGKRVQITMVGNYHNGCNPFHVPLARQTFA